MRLSPIIETEAMKFGKAVHTYLFEFQQFNNTYVTEPKVDKRTKIGKEWLWKVFKGDRYIDCYNNLM